MGKNGRGGRRNQKLVRPSGRPIPPADKSTGTTFLPEKTTGRTLPEDLLDEILYRTPVKSLVRFRCVCKSWLLRTLHPKFIGTHLHSNTLRNQQTIFHTYDYSSGETREVIAFLLLTDPPISIFHIDKSPKRRDYPRKINFPDFSKEMVLAGSVNGIVCLSHAGKMLGRFVVLWNPAINYWKPIQLPQPKSQCEWLSRMSVGLGYDEAADDFKIICIVRVEKSLSQVEMYSVNMGSWKDVEGRTLIPFVPGLPNCNFVIKGSPYWIGFYEVPDIEPINLYHFEILMKFDPSTGLHKKFPFPIYTKNEGTMANPVKLRDSVAVLIQSPGDSPNQMVDMFMLDEDTANWTKIYTIGPHPFENIRIPRCFNTGEIVIETWKGDFAKRVPYVYDPRTGHVRYNDAFQVLDPLWYESYSHVDSLVCVKGMELIRKEDKSKKKTKPRNWIELLSKDFELLSHM